MLDKELLRLLAEMIDDERAQVMLWFIVVAVLGIILFHAVGGYGSGSFMDR